MLDIHLSSTIADQTWHAASQRAALPGSTAEYLAGGGPTAEAPESRRRFRRLRCRGRAATQHGQRRLGLYLADVSPMGVGFYSPVQMFPLDAIRIVCDQHPAIDVEIRRCLRIEENCYACGAKFIHGRLLPGEYKQFLHALRA